ncbi:hypothetical protein PoB_006001300 [Plakobranchus ocellatus]|uniref:Uncharacterized protein n=1 Tax=Plakobranchus ocellatus TaxID=259542 RepID=A0AAV4CNN6_9GAST|nr:hypothetical protein PoB_006001300 [Plakobranchus ocellatus]
MANLYLQIVPQTQIWTEDINMKICRVCTLQGYCQKVAPNSTWKCFSCNSEAQLSVNFSGIRLLPLLQPHHNPSQAQNHFRYQYFSGSCNIITNQLSHKTTISSAIPCPLATSAASLPPSQSHNFNGYQYLQRFFVLQSPL